MPKKYGLKEKDFVVAHVVNLVLTGKMRTGDRIDRNEIAKQLGLSRVPIQEAMVQLEHDGVISTRYHRGAFIERFDAATVLEHHEIFAQLSAMASERAAADEHCVIIDKLESLLAAIKTSTDGPSFQESAWEYRQTIYTDYAGPRLLALIRGSQSFMPRGFWIACTDSLDEMVVLYEDETRAIREHDQAAARSANIRRGHVIGRLMLAELSRRGILTDLHSG